MNNLIILCSWINYCWMGKRKTNSSVESRVCHSVNQKNSFDANVKTMDNLWEFWDFSGRLRFNKQTHTCIFRLITSIQMGLMGPFTEFKDIIWSYSHLVCYHLCKLLPAAADRESPRRRSTDIRACSRRFCWRPPVWQLSALSRRLPVVECFRFRNICNRSKFNWATINSLIDLTTRSYLPKILLTHPLETCKILEISHGRAPECASSTIFCLVESGSGRPPTKTPPSWLTPLCPFILTSFFEVIGIFVCVCVICATDGKCFCLILKFFQIFDLI